MHEEFETQNKWRIQASKLSDKVASHFERLAKLNYTEFNKRYDRTIDKDEELIRIRWQEMMNADTKRNGRLVFKSGGQTIAVNLYARIMLLMSGFVGDSLTAKISTLELKVSIS